MKVLLAYDGTAGADAAVDDLARAGLPAAGEVRVLTVGDGALPPLVPRPGTRWIDEERAARQAVWEAENVRAVNDRGVATVAERLPGWTVRGFSRGGSPASTILLHADAWAPDLLVVGSRARVRPLRTLLGSVARKIVSEARCTVRIARPTGRAPGAPAQIVVGHDGRDGGREALRAACARAWPAGSEVCVVAAHAVAPVTMFANEVPWEIPWPVADVPAAPGTLLGVVEADAAACRRAGLAVVAQMRVGSPAAVLLHEARRRAADSVFVGATGTSRFERFLLGSVSSAVADRARCPVEVVRWAPAPQDAA